MGADGIVPVAPNLGRRGPSRPPPGRSATNRRSPATWSAVRLVRRIQSNDLNDIYTSSNSTQSFPGEELIATVFAEHLASDHKYLRICDLCKELASISKAHTDKSSIYHNLFHSKLLLHQFLESNSERDRRDRAQVLVRA